MRAALPAASVAEFSAAEIGGECTESSGATSAPPHYVVLVEAARDQPALPTDAAARLEAALREANPVYAAWRDKGAIGPCEQREVRCGFDLLPAHPLNSHSLATRVTIDWHTATHSAY